MSTIGRFVKHGLWATLASILLSLVGFAMFSVGEDMLDGWIGLLGMAAVIFAWFPFWPITVITFEVQHQWHERRTHHERMMERVKGTSTAGYPQ